MFLESVGIKYLSHIVDAKKTSIYRQAWKSTDALRIPLQFRLDWDGYINSLVESHTRISDREDELIWAISFHGRYTPKQGYLSICADQEPVIKYWWWRPLWKLKSPPKEKLFMWFFINNKVPTEDNLMHRYFHGPECYCLCKNMTESITHLFLSCPITQHVWQQLYQLLNISIRWQGENFNSTWKYWWDNAVEHKLHNLPLLVCWGIWIAHNKQIFWDITSDWKICCSQIQGLYNLIPEEDQTHRVRNIIPEIIDKSQPWAYFDGSVQAARCGGGAILYLTETHFFKLKMGLGRGTNNYDELN